MPKIVNGTQIQCDCPYLLHAKVRRVNRRGESSDLVEAYWKCESCKFQFRMYVGSIECRHREKEITEWKRP